MSVREPLIRLIDSRLSLGVSEIIATSVSPAYKWFDATLHEYLWAMDVELLVDGNRPDSGALLRAVPIADASHAAHKAGPGSKLRLHRSRTRRTYEIVGTASIVPGQVSVFEVTYSTDGYTVGGPVTFGSSWRPLNYTELGDSVNNGGHKYGSLPYGTIGKFNAAGTLVYVYAG